MDAEPESLWNRHDVAEWLGIDVKSVNGWVRRRKVPVAGHGEPERGGVPNLYRPADIRAAKQAMPGKGNRTPRTTPTER